jgi:energy-coupling factor transporter ATP-binding protein EcfA2
MIRLDARPLYDNAADARLLVSSEALAQALRALENGLNVLILGERGAGKTTLLNALSYGLRKRKRPVRLLNVAEDASAADILRRVAGVEGGDPLPRLAELASEQPDTVILIDGLLDATVAYDLFGRMRDRLWQLPFTWAAAVDALAADVVRAPPADAFFPAVVEPLRLNEPQRKELLEKRLKTSVRKGLISELAAVGPENPRRLLDVARRVVVDEVPVSVAANLDAAQRAARLGRPHSMLFAELEAIGEASPTDPELMRRMGWTRQRISKVLEELEAEGLVTARDERQTVRGRPRRLYRVTAPWVAS